MHIDIIAVGKQMPKWVEMGVADYLSRLPRQISTRLIEIAAEKRGKNADVSRILSAEEKKINDAITPGTVVVALDRLGKAVSTKQLAVTLQDWFDDQQTVAIIIGGPEGLTTDFLQKANMIWSISALTLPHPLVRVVLSEQIYRAWSITINHPYHR